MRFRPENMRVNAIRRRPSKVDNNRHIDVEAYKQNLRASGSLEI
jgi:hypothetical protein